MSTKSEKLIVEPENELRFVGPFNKNVITNIQLTNRSLQTMIFKIKTTAPKLYCVRPNTGIINSKSSTKVEICLLPFKYDPNASNKHKFMVQSILAPAGEYTDLEYVWTDIDPNIMTDAKLVCVFEMPHEIKPHEIKPHEIKQEKYAPSIEAVAEKVVKDRSSLNIPSEQKDLMPELLKLRKENSQLRTECVSLQEKIILLQSMVRSASEDIYSTALSEQQDQKELENYSAALIAFVIAAAIFGLLLGKYVL